MRVRELLALVPRLKEADQEDIVVINPGSSSILLFNVRPGLHQEDIQGLADRPLTEADRDFLRALRVSG